ncbi:MAG: hydrolase, partial [Clostridia bacterium]|nr:hydrolase [Clostridia bacterium]
MVDVELNKARFLKIYEENIKREGGDKLLKWLCDSDFFVAPASSKFHNAVVGGLCDHSLNVYDRV